MQRHVPHAQHRRLLRGAILGAAAWIIGASCLAGTADEEAAADGNRTAGGSVTTVSPPAAGSTTTTGDSNMTAAAGDGNAAAVDGNAAAVVLPTKPSSSLTTIAASARDDATVVRAESHFYNASFMMDVNNPIVRLHTTLWVPAKPPASNLLFIWPGLQGPDAGGGVLQPVLVWGANACISPDTDPPADFSTWWIAGYYVDSACHVGRAIPVNVGDALDLDLASDHNVWTLTIQDLNTGGQTSFAYDLGGRRQNFAIFSVEPYNQYPTEPVVFGSSTITFANVRDSGCKLYDIGQNNGITDVVLSADKKSCSFSTLILRNALP